MRHKTTNHTKLLVQALESRLMMAGDVTAYFASNRAGLPNDILIVEGDQAANEVRIIEDGVGGASIEGLNGTTVNGQASVTLHSDSNSIVHASVDLAGGDDALQYQLPSSQSAAHGTKIRTGNGDDSVSINAASALGALDIATGNGADRVTFDLAATALLHALELNTGNGSDEILFKANDAGTSLIALRPSHVETGNGDDVVRFQGTLSTQSDKEFAIRLGSGDDQLIGDPSGSLEMDRLDIDGGKGFDSVFADSYFLSDLDILLSNFETL